MRKAIITCDICSYQSVHQGDFSLHISGAMRCMRCSYSWDPNYTEPSWFAKRYGIWEKFVEIDTDLEG